MSKELFMGLDLGQAKDYTALAIVERSGEDSPSYIYSVPFLHRYELGTKYPAIVDDVVKMTKTPQLARTNLTLAIDQTGVGAPVVDMFTRSELRTDIKPVHITGGSQETCERGVYYVPKRVLVSLVQVALQNGRLKISSHLKYASTLTGELQNFQVKITENAHDTYGAWREGTHDDLVLALALALWAAQRQGVGVYI